jgi:hypothetical protein
MPIAVESRFHVKLLQWKDLWAENFLWGGRDVGVLQISRPSPIDKINNA